MQTKVLFGTSLLPTLQRSVQLPIEMREPQVPSHVPLGAVLPMPTHQNSCVCVRADHQNRSLWTREDGATAEMLSRLQVEIEMQPPFANPAPLPFRRVPSLRAAVHRSA